MTRPAVMPTLTASICPFGWAARSSQRSARAGDAPDKVSAIAPSSASVIASRVDLRNFGLNAMVNCPLALLKRPEAVSARPGAGSQSEAVDAVPIQLQITP